MLYKILSSSFKGHFHNDDAFVRFLTPYQENKQTSANAAKVLYGKSSYTLDGQDESPRLLCFPQAQLQTTLLLVAHGMAQRIC